MASLVTCSRSATFHLFATVRAFHFAQVAPQAVAQHMQYTPVSVTFFILFCFDFLLFILLFILIFFYSIFMGLGFRFIYSILKAECDT
jgi:hypothetical protein